MRKKQLLTAVVLAAMMAIPSTMAFATVDDTTPPVIDNLETPDAPGNPDNVAVDVDGTPYPEGGPADLYEAIEDKQDKLDTNPEHKGHENALSRLRRNLERALSEIGIGDDAPDTPDTLDTPEGIEDPENPDNVAVDAEGTPYPQGGPAGLYTAIADKQAKLLADPNNPGLNNALSRLRGNLEKQLDKRGISMDSEIELDAEAGEEVASVEKKEKVAKKERVEKKERVAKKERVEKKERVAKAERPEKRTKVEKPSKPERPARAERPSKPERPVKAERPSKPEKPVKVERPSKPTKPEKPGRPSK